ncbi:HIRAN domain-containing protein [Denitratisoma oestradiolicum]|uniref:HIRAN protein n=1 Tax=Denitratisoma oestradiolicum TaxID=311182 RepID=A0A6S6Y181_9PROT|nr:HIRAN domain-containing protein [Denitratisoma oestradiolicum]TWO80443.1 HIRAN protein [Denitratisoma oestradiolicum]CAB1370255.1 HIRAN protein [Denitratisoma oestradiolicum]
MRFARISLLSTLCLLSMATAAESIRLLVQSSPLAGFQYYAGTAHWEEMRPGDRLDLIREPDNPHDPRAVRVEWRGDKLGYLPRKENQAVAAEMDRGGQVEARIARLRQHRNPWQRVLIEVYVTL